MWPWRVRVCTWRPAYNLLEGQFEVLVVNAQHLKAIPGRKTDVRDAEWIADLFHHGLLKGSYIPSSSQRDLRDLTATGSVWCKIEHALSIDCKRCWRIPIS